jgi:hypothetical protein
MDWARKCMIGVLAFSLLLAPQFILADPQGLNNNPAGITKNVPKIIVSEEVTFDGAGSGGKESVLRPKLIWIVVGAAVLTGLVLGGSGGGGGGDGDGDQSGSSQGDVSVEW